MALILPTRAYILALTVGVLVPASATAAPSSGPSAPAARASAVVPGVSATPAADASGRLPAAATGPAGLPVPTVPPSAPASAAVVVRRAVHVYSLPECLALAERNHPNLWAARARLASFHAQLDEAKWTPFFQGWSANATIGVIPPLGGTPYYGATQSVLLNPSFNTSFGPFFQFSVNGGLPLYTFGKITGYWRAAEAQIRAGEWDLEKFRQQVRFDVRRAYFNLLLARDALYIADEALKGVDKGLDKINEHLEKSDSGYDEVDRLRLQFYKDELIARTGDARRGETIALAALRFLTGVATQFDVPDEPLKRPDVPVRPVVRYLAAARLFRPEVNYARAGVAARRALTEVAQARFFPDIYLGMNASYLIAPNATQQTTAWVLDPFNRFGWGAALGVRWGLDVLPNQARLVQGESLLEETRSLERLALGGIAVEVETAYGAVNEAKVREEAWSRNEHLAKGWLSSVRDAIDLGTKDERYLIEPTRFYIGARVAHVQALMDYNIALSELARVSGIDSVAPDAGPGGG
ncbi:MAG: TolC family protein [Myxococcales bacterium]|nr:TolC family protein [Myxococcales bacterium]